MKLQYILLLAAILFALKMHSQVTVSDKDLDKIVQSERRSAPILDLSKPLESGLYLDVTYYGCRWNIDPAIRAISGSVKVGFKTLVAGADSVSFDLSNALTVDSVKYHSTIRPWYHVLDVLAISLPVSLPLGASDSVTIFYHGIPFTGSGSFIQGSHQGAPGIWTISEPYGASDWWPCKNGLTDKADSIDVYVTTPAGNRTAGNGILVSELNEGDYVIAHWKHRYPIAAYLVALAVTNYARFDMTIPYGDDDLPMITYVYPEDSAAAVTQSAVIVDMVQLFDSLFGIYPFRQEKYGHAQWNVGGGMEHQTMTFLDSFGFELMAHELAHQWYGNAVTCGSWTDIWLNEGFATYLSGLCYEFLVPDLWTRFREVRVNKIISQPGGSVYCPDTTNIARIFDGRLSYAKGCMILHQLRWIYGDSVFFTAMNHYLHDPDLYYGFVRNSDFKSHFEAVCGEDLTWYFDDWYTGEGYPSYDIGWGQDGNAVSITVNQTQSHPSVSFFEMTIPLLLKNSETDTMVRLANTFNGQSYTLEIPFAVDSVIFDPDYQLISGNNIVNGFSEEEIRRLVQVFPNPATRHLTFKYGKLQVPEQATLRIFDLAGSVVETFPFKPGETEQTLNISNYSPGFYSYVISFRDSQVNGKFLVVPSSVSE